MATDEQSRAAELVRCGACVHTIEWCGNTPLLLDHGDHLGERVLVALGGEEPRFACFERVERWLRSGVRDVAALVARGCPVPSERWLCFDEHEAALWEVTGLARTNIVRWGVNLGAHRLLRALEAGVPDDYVAALAVVGADREVATWWFATCLPAWEAVARVVAGSGPHLVHDWPSRLQATATVEAR